MTKKNRDQVKDNKEQAAYVLFYSFIIFFLLDTVFGLMAGSNCLLVCGVSALFGVLVAVVALLRINRSHPPRGGRIYFNPDKLEFFILLGTSVIIALSTGTLFFAIGHMIFFHTLYPSELSAAWVAMTTAVLVLGLMVWMKTRIIDLPEIEAQEVEVILNTFFLLSVTTMITVVVARAGAPLLDYGCAIFMAFFLILYSMKFLAVSFKGLMDASCDKATTVSIEKLISKCRAGVALKELKVNKAGHVLEIIATFTMVGETSMKDAATAVKKIKAMFQERLLKPHELFIGIVGEK